MPLTDMLQDKVARLYFELLTQRVKDQYRGHEDYHLIMDSIRSNFPLVGANVKVQRTDRKGNFYTRSYKVVVKDDLGNFISGVEDIGGQCCKGEIVKKGFIFTCMECGQLFCRRHIKFVDNDPRKPLCNYGIFGLEGCYKASWRQYSAKYIGRNYEEADTNVLRETLLRKKLIAEIAKHDMEIDNINSSPALSLPPSQERTSLPPPTKKTGLLGRLWYGGVHSVTCGNCDERISLSDVLCPNCRNVIDLDIDAPLACPICHSPITEVDCPHCQAVNKL